MRCESPGLNLGIAFQTGQLEYFREGRIPRVAVKCVEMWRNTEGEGSPWECTDAHVRKRGEQTGLDTLVVHAVNAVDLGIGV